MAEKQKEAKKPQVADGDQRMFFVYRDGQEAYAVPPTSVVEIITKAEATPVPFTPDWLDGVISARGEITPVLDLQRYFRLPSPPSKSRNRLILVSVNTASFTMWSDQIVGVEAIEESRLEQPLSNLPEALQKCLSGQFRMEDTLVYCIDLTKLLKEARDQMKAL
jgi:purine-binding chemotaxis protein CheW